MVEKHKLNDYVIIPRSTPSKLIKGARQQHDLIFCCPDCGEKQPVPEHMKDSECKNRRCKLQWQAFGASIKLWRNK